MERYSISRNRRLMSKCFLSGLDQPSGDRQLYYNFCPNPLSSAKLALERLVETGFSITKRQNAGVPCNR
jgi:hypothetical protein